MASSQRDPVQELKMPINSMFTGEIYMMVQVGDVAAAHDIPRSRMVPIL